MKMSRPAGAVECNQTELSIVVPCHNEETSLKECFQRILIACEPVTNGDFEIVFVNDGSTDGTWRVMESIVESDSRVVCLDLSRNFGHQAALIAGLHQAIGKRVLILDADLQDPPELLTEMWRLLDNGADVVFGKRRSRRGDSHIKKLSAKGFYWLLSNLASTEIPRDVGDFRLMNRAVVDVILSMPESYPFVRGMVAWAGFHQVSIYYDREERISGDTSYSNLRMLALAIDGITGFSIAPLRLITILAFLTLLLALLFFGYSIYGWLKLSVVPGWTSLFSIVLFLGSMQMLALGVIGEYVGRIFIETKRRPVTVIRHVLRGK